MAKAIVTIKLMPESPSTDLDGLQKEASSKIEKFSQTVEVKAETEPVAFGLKALKLTFIMDESLGSPEELEKDLATLKSVNSVEVIDVRRAVG